MRIWQHVVFQGMHGGTLIFGVNDKDELIGLTDPKMF